MAGPHEDSDVLAMSRLREGDDLALNDIMDRWQTRLTGYLIRLTGSEATAVDLAQETFVRVYGNRFRYRASGAFSTWLFAIASNLARHHLRWQLRHPTISMDAAAGTSGSVLESVQAADPDPRVRLERAERAEAVREAIAELAPDLREAFYLRGYVLSTDRDDSAMLNQSRRNTALPRACLAAQEAGQMVRSRVGAC